MKNTLKALLILALFSSNVFLHTAEKTRWQRIKAACCCCCCPKKKSSLHSLLIFPEDGDIRYPTGKNSGLPTSETQDSFTSLHSDNQRSESSSPRPSSRPELRHIDQRSESSSPLHESPTDLLRSPSAEWPKRPKVPSL